MGQILRAHAQLHIQHMSIPHTQRYGWEKSESCLRIMRTAPKML